MPLFTYRCQECGGEFERFVAAMAEADEPQACPKCGSLRSERQQGLFSTRIQGPKGPGPAGQGPACGQFG